MDRFVRNLLTEWRRLGLPFRGETIVIAVSGGADSMSLTLAFGELARLRKIENRFVVAHFDHRLRAGGDNEAAIVRKCASEMGFDFEPGAASGDFAIERSGNLEQNARQARYRFLSDVAFRREAFAVVTAHTLDDQAETYLMNMLRGSGPDGLSAMGAVVDAFTIDGSMPVRLVRPMIGWARRAMTEEFCADRSVGVVSDPMNEDVRFVRVRIRRELIPLLETFNPRIIDTLGRNAALFGASRATARAEIDLSLKALGKLSRSELFSQLRVWIRGQRGHLRGIGVKHLEAIERLMTSRKSGRLVQLPGGGTVRREAGKLHFGAGSGSDGADAT